MRLLSYLRGPRQDLRVLKALDASGLEYSLIGATATGLHGLVRATEDIDLFIKLTAENVARLRAALRVERLTVESEVKDDAGTRVPLATPAALYRLK